MKQLPTEPPSSRLRDQLVASLQVRADEDTPVRPVAVLAERYERMRGAASYGVAGELLHSPSEAAVELLERMLGDDNPLVAIEAGAALAVLGNRAGVDVLRATQTCTSSQIEFFYARAGLTLLGEEIPEELAKQRSVFRHLEELLE